MSQFPPSPDDPLRPDGADDTPSAQDAPQRAASVTLRDVERRESETLSMDPAHRSLAEALRITFFLLQIGMAVLILLFLLSGARQVKEAERGVRLTFGKVVEQDLPPGLHFSWPYPIGEFLTIDTGARLLDVDRSFWPNLSEFQRRRSLDENRLHGNMGLEPGEDGALITGDGFIVHTQWRVIYRRERPVEYVRNIYGPDEATLVRSVVERAVVQAVAEVNIETLLKQGVAVQDAPAPTEQPAPAPTEADAATPEPPTDDAPAAPSETPAAAPDEEPDLPRMIVPRGAESSIMARARQLAQEALDAIDAGIRIEEAALVSRSPPLSVRESFTAVQTAQSSAEKSREEAEKYRRETLNAAAGSVHPVLLSLIDAYERAVELGDEDEANDVLARIDAVFDGEAVVVPGLRGEHRLSGFAANILGDARQYRTSVVAQSRTAAETFRGKLEQFRANPSVLVNREWTDSYLDFLGRSGAQLMLLPEESILELWLNRDPEIARRLEQMRNLRDVQSALGQAEERWERERQRTRERDAAGDGR